MKLDYVAHGSSDSPLIRLFDFTSTEAKQLHASVTALAAGAAERVEVHNLSFVEAVDRCRLALVLRSWDQAVVRAGDAGEFECGFTASTWDNVAALIEPFTANASGFQWLAGLPGEAALLLSPSGQW